MNDTKNEKKINRQIEEIEDDIEDFQDKSEKKNLRSVANLFRKVRSSGDVEKKCYMFGRALGRLWGIYKNRPSNWLKKFLFKSRYVGIGPLAKEIKKFAKSSNQKTDLKSFSKIIEILQKTANSKSMSRSALCYSEIPEAITGLTEAEVNVEIGKRIKSMHKGARVVVWFGYFLACVLTCDTALLFGDKFLHSKYIFGDENEIDRKIAKLIVKKNFDKMKEGIFFEYKKIKNVINKQSKTFENLLKKRESFLNK